MPGPYRAHHYIGEYADDAGATAAVVAKGWDVAGAPQPGMLYYNTVSNEFKFWNATGWTSFGGGPPPTPGGHLGIGGGVGGTQFNFEDHDIFNISYCWDFDFIDPVTDLPWGAAWYYTQNIGVDLYYSYRLTGDLLPTNGVPPNRDFAIWRHVKIRIPVLVSEDFVEQHMMVKGFYHGRGVGCNALVGFAGAGSGISWPQGGVYENAGGGSPKAGIYFARDESFTNPQNWYACVCEGATLYAVDTGVDGDNVRKKFHVRVDHDNAWFYIDNVIVATITETDAGVSWPALIDLWPCIGITTATGGAVQYYLIKLPLIHASQSAPIPP